jgi:hypothetical protein
MTNNAVFMFLMVFFTACASAPNVPAPAWVANIQSVYPRDIYITGRGSGSARQDAEANALAEIALYFVRETSVERSRRASWSERDGITTAESRTEENILVESQTRLVAIRYVDDPWLNPATKSWETAAYIERDEAWAIYEPVAKRLADTFMSLIKAADGETEPFNAVLRYGTAAAYSRSAEFNAARDFAQVLHPAQAGILFAGTDSAMAGLLEKQLLAREKAVISVECPVDHDQLIYQAMVKSLGASGFTTGSGRTVDTVCLIRVEEGVQRQDSGTMYFPSLIATISGSSGAMMSFRVTGERVGASNPDVAKRRAFTVLAAALEGVFAEELQHWQSSLINK